MFLAALDFNIVATAVPTITSEFHKYRNSSWIGTSFLVSFSLVLPIYAKLGVMFGNRNMFIIGTLIFIVGSGLCGAASSMDLLVWSRVVQGIGGGGIYGLVNVSPRWTTTKVRRILTKNRSLSPILFLCKMLVNTSHSLAWYGPLPMS